MKPTMLGAAILLYLGSALVFVSVPMCLRSWKRVVSVLVAWTTCYLCWYLYSPLYEGPPLIIKSADRDVELHGVAAQLGDTVSCDPRLVRVSDPADVVAAIATSVSGTGVRVAGGTHSWSGLICTNETLIMLEGCDMDLQGDTLVASAGCKVNEAQQFLGGRNRVLHGFGSIMKQTLGGSIMTSLHGAQFDMFTDHLTALEAVLADGTATRVEGDDLKWWASSMGMLGVVTKVELTTFAYTSVRRVSTFETFDAAIAQLENESLHGLAMTGVLESDTFFVEAFVDPQPANFTKLYEHDPWFVFGYDNIVQPLFVLFGWVIRGLDITRLQFSEEDRRLELTHAWSHIVGYSSGSGSEYSVPLRNCRAALEEMRAMNAYSHVYLRKVRGSDAPLAFAKEDSCAIDPYLFYTYNYGVDHEAFMERLEYIVSKYEGRTHWGKKWHLEYGEAVPEAFKAYRNTLDPTGVFMNNFTRALLNGDRFEYKPLAFACRGAVWVTCVWVTVALVPLVFLLPTTSWNRLFQISFGALAALFAWIAVNIHDNKWEEGQVHGHNHAGAALSVLWLVLAALLLLDTMFAYKRPIWVLLLRGGVAAGVLVDACIKLWGCDACEHGIPTLLVGVALGSQIALMAVDKPVPADYKKLQQDTREPRFP